MDGVHTNMTNTRNTPAEVIESAYPLRVDRYGLVPDTAAPGDSAAVLGLTRELTVLDHPATINLSSDRLKSDHGDWRGDDRGGTVASSLELPTGECVALPSKTTRTVKAGTRIILRTAGGGGYGDPCLRDPQHVRPGRLEWLHLN